jgi:hypothetical protein
MNSIKKLESWFAQQCDGEWEHENLLKIETIDNPGWSISIDLTGIITENATNKPWALIRDDVDNWYGFKLVEGVFSAWGGQSSLEELIEILLNYTSENPRIR